MASPKTAARQVAAKQATAKAAVAKAPARKTAAKTVARDARWSRRVTETSDALDLEPDVFTGSDPHAIARSLKASAEHSDRRKADPYRSAMSMLTFYINRAGHNLPPARKKTLEAAKDALRALYDKSGT